jgi:uncharacterized Fe-S cluster-containing radical SAM superfamily protein
LILGFKPFDALELARETERIVTREGPEGLERKYTDFYATGVYGGIATGYAVGCCLRCIFCWVGWSRDFPEKHGDFCSPKEAFRRLAAAAHGYGVEKLRISGAEPTLGKDHLLSLLEHVERSQFKQFILETNGILLGVDENYVQALSRFKKVHVRVSLKAGTGEAFVRKTGATPEAFELPFQAIRNLEKFGVSFHVAAMSLDPRIMDREERRNLLDRLWSTSPLQARSLEEEVVDPYETTLARLEKSGQRLEWPLKRIYRPVRSWKK